jgi:hypothetical protein
VAELCGHRVRVAELVAEHGLLHENDEPVAGLMDDP